MIRITLAALALGFPMIACASNEGQSPPPAAVPATVPAFVPASVVVAFDRESVTPLITEGVRNFETNEPVEFNDPVRIASISKLIMALATLRLADEGKIDLDADVSDYLGFKVRSPNFPDTKVTLIQLLSHRAGLRDSAGYIIPLGESLEAKLKDPDAWYADAPPGVAPFEYANLGSPVVATALEAATGERYDALMERTVFQPLGVKACVNWIGCSDDMIARAVALYRHTGEPARDYPDDLPPNCPIPVAEGVECSLDDYVPGTNASVFSPQGGVRIGMMDLAKIGQALGRAYSNLYRKDRPDSERAADRAVFDAYNLKLVLGALLFGKNKQQEFFCIYGIHFQAIPATRDGCLDDLFGDHVERIGHSGEAYGLQSGLWFNVVTGEGFAFFRTQAPPPTAGEDTGGFSQGEKDLMKRAQDVLATKANK